jgi:hypothetical protein
VGTDDRRRLRARARHSAQGQQADGFTIYASKTVGVPIVRLFDAFANEPTRSRWLTDGAMALRSSREDLVAARFDWGDGLTRVSVTFDAKGPARATAFVSHERLPDADAAEAAKTAWRAAPVGAQDVPGGDRCLSRE